MNLARFRIWSLWVAAVMGLALLVGTGSASAASGTASVLPQAGLAARGAGVVVQVTVNCSTGSTFRVRASVAQRVSRTASTFGFGDRAPSACTGASQTVRVGIPVASQETVSTQQPPAAKAFVLNSALAGGDVQICDDPNNSSTCVDPRFSGTVHVQAINLNRPTFSTSGFTTTLPPQGSIQARGVGAVIRLPYQCDAAVSGELEMSLTQHVGTTVIQNFDFVDIVCDSTAQTGVLTFFAGGPFWTTGPAFATLEANNLCDPSGCIGDQIAFRSLNLTVPAH